ncbi:hypothetical protein GGQ85_002129 [Nitrobacter vulgaris]|nr:hypothetical protein [Nitrobacter vulgaris]
MLSSSVDRARCALTFPEPVWNKTIPNRRGSRPRGSTFSCYGKQGVKDLGAARQNCHFETVTCRINTLSVHSFYLYNLRLLCFGSTVRPGFRDGALIISKHSGAVRSFKPSRFVSKLYLLHRKRIVSDHELGPSEFWRWSSGKSAPNSRLTPQCFAGCLTGPVVPAMRLRRLQ